ncbi:Hypothetical protein SMAX5B_012000 [Scophthalmus maximus]|uniref:Uncharacterized protein n=1 Tax=Scophthalmus maximus TaxID=52904 RepID=A0A2U9AXC6_SCOMX|nr:Hypothetical protein SMAX5B_012000 [Scophthalmus maximus]
MNVCCDFTSPLKEGIQVTMNHRRGRDLSNKENKQSDPANKPCCCKRLKCYKTDGQPKRKRLKTRKQRCRMRGEGKEASKTKSYHHRCHLQTSGDTAPFHNCCRQSGCSSRRDAPFPKVVQVAQEPSIITDSRLLGHHGLFSHEVKSIDIQRLLSEQGRLGKGQKDQEEKHTIFCASSTSHIPTPFFSNVSGTDTGEVVPFEGTADPAAHIHVYCQERGKLISHESDITPGQRPQQRFDNSSGSYKSIFSSKHSSFGVEISKSKGPVNSVMREKDKAPQLTPTVDHDIVKISYKKIKTHMISAFGPTPKNQEHLTHQTHARSHYPSPPQLSSSPAADSFGTRHRRQGPGGVSKSVTAMGARLCDCLQFPQLRRRNLLAESREVLLTALRERHGPRFQEKLLQEQQRFSLGTDLAIQDHDQEPTMRDENHLLPTDASAFQADAVSQLYFDCQKTTASKEMRSKHFNQKSSRQPHQSSKWTAECLTRTVDTSASLLDDVLRPSCSPPFCMDFELSGASGSDRLFTFSPTSCWGEKASAPQQVGSGFNRPECKDSIFDSFGVVHQPVFRSFREMSCGPQFPNETQLPEIFSAEPMHFLPEQDPFKTGIYITNKIHDPNQSRHFSTFGRSSHLSTYRPVSSHHTDMMHYPPSHMLERGPAAPLSSLPSPEQWSFPPMKLY